MPQKNINKVLAVFRKNYKLIPLETFKKSPYKILISTVLSSRTRDETTFSASKRLFQKAKNFRQLQKLTEKQIEDARNEN